MILIVAGALEPPQPDEHAVTVAADGDPQDTVAAIIAIVRPVAGAHPGGADAPGGDHEAET